MTSSQPGSTEVTDPTPRDLLDLVITDSDVGDVKLRSYVHQLFEALWQQVDSFSGKRPFGSSDWQWRVYAAMGRAGYVEAVFDDYGDLEAVDMKRADALVIRATQALLLGDHAPDEPMDVYVDDTPPPPADFAKELNWDDER